jgi:hypothetical protein
MKDMKNATTNTVSFQVVRDFAGVRKGRASSPFERFADANRYAMRVCAEKSVRVYVVVSGAQVVAEYEPANGRAQCVPVI